MLSLTIYSLIIPYLNLDESKKLYDCYNDAFIYVERSIMYRIAVADFYKRALYHELMMNSLYINKNYFMVSYNHGHYYSNEPKWVFRALCEPIYRLYH